MSRLSKQRAKEKFLKGIEGVSKETIFEEIKNNSELDLYTYFITKDAYNRGVLEEKEVGDFLAGVYADWYFLHKNTRNKNPKAVKILSEFNMAPVNLTSSKCFDMVKSGAYSDILPVFFQYVNKLEEKYFICVRTDELFNREFKNMDYAVRLYINFPHDKVLEFAKEFLNKAYTEELPALLKILNGDYRFDTITIYTDYEYVEKIIETIDGVKYESRSLFEETGRINPMLAGVNDYIGFGEQTNPNSTYFATRTRALSSIGKCAGLKLLKDSIVAKEKEIIFRKDGSKFTPTEYLSFLIERNAKKLIESKIQELESEESIDESRVEKLYAMRDSISSAVDISSEVEKVKKTFTRNGDYTLKIDGVGELNYNYLNKLYGLFTTEDERLLRYAGDRARKRKVNSKLFGITDMLSDIKTKDFLDIYFKSELGIALKNFIDSELTSIKRVSTSSVLGNIKKKSVAKLQSILRSILNDGDDGREYIGDCIYDYVRILSSGSTENVEISIDGRDISIEKDVSADLINMLPELKENIEKLTISTEFIDSILEEFDINKDNISVCSDTKNMSKAKEKKKDNAYEYYYNPEGYLSR